MSNKVVRVLESFTDFVGNTVKVGAHVVYATTSGRSPVQKLALVDRIELVENEYRKGEFVRVGVREIANGRGFYRSGDTWNKETRSYDHDPEPAKRVSYPLSDNMVLVRTPEEIEAAALPQKLVFSDSPESDLRRYALWLLEEEGNDIDVLTVVERHEEPLTQEEVDYIMQVIDEEAV